MSENGSTPGTPRSQKSEKVMSNKERFDKLKVSRDKYKEAAQDAQNKVKSLEEVVEMLRSQGAFSTDKQQLFVQQEKARTLERQLTENTDNLRQARAQLSEAASKATAESKRAEQLQALLDASSSGGSDSSMRYLFYGAVVGAVATGAAGAAGYFMYKK